MDIRYVLSEEPNPETQEAKLEPSFQIWLKYFSIEHCQHGAWTISILV